MSIKVFTDMLFPMSETLPCDVCNSLHPECWCPADLGLSETQLPARLRPADHPSVITRFMSYIEVSTTSFHNGTPCHIWTGGKSRGGKRWSLKAFYGTFNPGGVVKGGVRAHVYIAWIRGLLKEMRVPPSKNLDHLCVNSLCVNHEHLELVPAIVNQQRKKSR